jgi:tetratricopeptide (TPR) repeat protein
MSTSATAGGDARASLDGALRRTLELLPTEPQLAAAQAQEILKVYPGQTTAVLYLASAERRLGRSAPALERLQVLVLEQPKWAAAHYELGLVAGALGKGDLAVQALRAALLIEPRLADAWRTLADHLHASGDTQGADAAYARFLQAGSSDPRLLAAAAALVDNDLPVAERLLREQLKAKPTDVAAIRMLAEVAGRLRRYADAESLLTRCLELAPGFAAARQNYALVLHRLNKPAAALAELDFLLHREPRSPGLRNLKAAVLGTISEYGPALELYVALVAEYPQQPRIWLSYGHALKTAGRTPDCIEAYRRTITLTPTLGEAWFSLANLKTFRFTAAETTAMRNYIEDPALSDEDRLHFQFALGKALEDEQDYSAAFAAYAAGNATRRRAVRYHADETTGYVQRARELFTPEFFAARRDFGSMAADPIFIVGLPRAGSTLVEQILASHSQVEGTMELPDLITIVRRLGGRGGGNSVRYPGALADLDAEQCRALGEEYLANTRIQRKTGAPFFIDKLPNNWAHVGLIQLILPNARIIDARRHPMSGCFSGFKQHFARGQHFTYSLDEIGRYYRDYVRLMAHIDRVLPGRVHRVIYEDMVADTETQVRALLAACGLPYEASCMTFYRNERAVRTASSEQVRQPIYTDSLAQWRHFEPWLDPLKSALGPVIDAYPEAPPD